MVRTWVGDVGLRTSYSRTSSSSHTVSRQREDDGCHSIPRGGLPGRGGGRRVGGGEGRARRHGLCRGRGLRHPIHGGLSVRKHYVCTQTRRRSMAKCTKDSAFSNRPRLATKGGPTGGMGRHDIFPREPLTWARVWWRRGRPASPPGARWKGTPPTPPPHRRATPLTSIRTPAHRDGERGMALTDQACHLAGT
jgi:hypothetical protein